MHAYGNLQVNRSGSCHAGLQAVVVYCHDSTLLKAADAQRTFLICFGCVNGSAVQQAVAMSPGLGHHEVPLSGKHKCPLGSKSSLLLTSRLQA